jgi:hypothetical protein
MEPIIAKTRQKEKKIFEEQRSSLELSTLFLDDPLQILHYLHLGTTLPVIQ